jgi:hypothetical protein
LKGSNINWKQKSVYLKYLKVFCYHLGPQIASPDREFVFECLQLEQDAIVDDIVELVSFLIEKDANWREEVVISYFRRPATASAAALLELAKNAPSFFFDRMDVVIEDDDHVGLLCELVYRVIERYPFSLSVVFRSHFFSSLCQRLLFAPSPDIVCALLPVLTLFLPHFTVQLKEEDIYPLLDILFRLVSFPELYPEVDIPADMSSRISFFLRVLYGLYPKTTFNYLQEKSRSGANPSFARALKPYLAALPLRMALVQDVEMESEFLLSRWKEVDTNRLLYNVLLSTESPQTRGPELTTTEHLRPVFPPNFTVNDALQDAGHEEKEEKQRDLMRRLRELHSEIITNSSLLVPMHNQWEAFGTPFGVSHHDQLLLTKSDLLFYQLLASSLFDGNRTTRSQLKNMQDLLQEKASLEKSLRTYKAAVKDLRLMVESGKKDVGHLRDEINKMQGSFIDKLDKLKIDRDQLAGRMIYYEEENKRLLHFTGELNEDMRTRMDASLHLEAKLNALEMTKDENGQAQTQLLSGALLQWETCGELLAELNAALVGSEEMVSMLRKRCGQLEWLVEQHAVADVSRLQEIEELKSKLAKSGEQHAAMQASMKVQKAAYEARIGAVNEKYNFIKIGSMKLADYLCELSGRHGELQLLYDGLRERRKHGGKTITESKEKHPMKAETKEPAAKEPTNKDTGTGTDTDTDLHADRETAGEDDPTLYATGLLSGLERVTRLSPDFVEEEQNEHVSLSMHPLDGASASLPGEEARSLGRQGSKSEIFGAGQTVTVRETLDSLVDRVEGREGQKKDTGNDKEGGEKEEEEEEEEEKKNEEAETAIIPNVLPTMQMESSESPPLSGIPVKHRFWRELRKTTSDSSVNTEDSELHTSAKGAPFGPGDRRESLMFDMD